jgi:hypothetical protein
MLACGSLRANRSVTLFAVALSCWLLPCSFSHFVRLTLSTSSVTPQRHPHARAGVLSVVPFRFAFFAISYLNSSFAHSIILTSFTLALAISNAQAPSKKVRQTCRSGYRPTPSFFVLFCPAP